jgi:hypothetical protein
MSARLPRKVSSRRSAVQSNFNLQQKTQIEFLNLYKWFFAFACRFESSHSYPKELHTQENLKVKVAISFSLSHLELFSNELEDARSRRRLGQCCSLNPSTSLEWPQMSQIRCSASGFGIESLISRQSSMVLAQQLY